MFQFSSEWKWRTPIFIAMHYEEYTSLEVKGQQELFLLPHSLLITAVQQTRTSSPPSRLKCPSEDVLHHSFQRQCNVGLLISSRQQITFSPFMQQLTEKLVKSIFDRFPRSYSLSHLQSTRPSAHGWQHSCSSRWSEGTLPPPPSSSCGPSLIPPSPYPMCVGEGGRRREEKRREEGIGEERQGREDGEEGVMSGKGGL